MSDAAKRILRGRIGRLAAFVGCRGEGELRKVVPGGATHNRRQIVPQHPSQLGEQASRRPYITFRILGVCVNLLAKKSELLHERLKSSTFEGDQTLFKQ